MRVNARAKLLCGRRGAHAPLLAVSSGGNTLSRRSRGVVPKRKRWCGGRRRVVTPVWLTASFVSVIRPSREFDFVDCHWYGSELLGFEFITPVGFELIRLTLVYPARAFLILGLGLRAVWAFRILVALAALENLCF